MRKRSAREPPTAGVDVAVEDQHDVQVTLLGEVARTYLDLRGFQRQIVVTRANLAAQEETVRLTRARFTAGISNELDLARAEALATATESDIPLLQARVRADMHALSVLLGEEPGPLARELEGLTDLPTLPDDGRDRTAGRPPAAASRRAARRARARARDRGTGRRPRRCTRGSALGGSIGQQSSSFSSLFERPEQCVVGGGGDDRAAS